MSTSITELLDKAAIRDVLSRYCRGLDRMDKPMAYAVFTADATANYYGIYEGTGHGFVDWVWQAHLTMATHSHQITNVLIEVDGDSAVSEAYVTVVLQQQRATGAVEMQARGRYLDRWSKCGEHWQIVAREHVIDTQSEMPLAAVGKSVESRRDDGDPSHALFA
jgi:hypothetical protein